MRPRIAPFALIATVFSAHGALAGTNPISTMFTADPTAPVYGQTVTLTVRLLPLPGAPVPTGQVTLQEGGTTIGSVTVTSEMAAVSLNTLAAGVHSISGSYSGDSYYSSTQIFGTVTVAKAATITRISLVQDVSGLRMVAQVSALPPGGGIPTGRVTFLDPRPNVGSIGTATLANGSGSAPWPYDSIVANGIVPTPSSPVTASYAGDSSFNGSTSAPLLHLISAAANLGVIFAPDEAVSLFNVTGLTGDTSSALPLRTSIEGTTVAVTDSTGQTRSTLLYGTFASTKQINFVIPSETGQGPAAVIVTLPDSTRLSTVVTISQTAASVFTANGNGSGIYAGQVVHVHDDGSQTVESSARFDPAAKSYVPNPIDMGPATDQVVLVLYGTGIRHAGPAGTFLPAIDVTVGTVDVPAVFAPQGQYPGLDQVNLMLPRSLAGAGTVNIALEVVISPNAPSSLLIPANKVTVAFQ